MSSATQVTVVEEPDEPQARRRSLDASGGACADRDIDWDNTQCSLLKPIGDKKPKLIAPRDKHSTNEGQHGFITFQVEGDPAPEIEWFKGFKDLSAEPRYKFWTFGDDNTITLGCNTSRVDDEGDYRVVLKNCNGTFEYEFKFFVTVEGGMDFRAALMKKKIKQRKVIVKKIEWLESPSDQEVQQGKCEMVTLVARLSEGGKKGKWYIRNAATFKDVRSSDFGLELFKGEHYDWKFTAAEKDAEPDTYTLNIINPTIAEGGTYSIVVRDLDMKTSCYIDVKAADPEFFFKKFLKPQENGLTARPLKLTAHLNVPLGPGPDGQPGWRVKWLKNGSAMQFTDQNKDARIQRVDKAEKTSLVFKTCELDDSGTYSVEIVEFVKNGEKDQTDCWLQVDEYPHTFTSKLKGQNVVEHDRCEFEIDCEAEDADVSWFRDGRKINPDEGRVEIVVEGKKRKLIFKDTLLMDAGEISCKTNKQTESCILKVAHANVFIKGLDTYTDAVEREESTFNVEVKDPNAPVDFYINGKKISKSDTRCEYVNQGEGKHQLILHKIKMEDMGTIEAKTPSNRGDEMIISSTDLEVAMGEQAPEVGECGDVTGVANKECHWKLPYKCEGVQQSPLDVIVMFRGKELKIGQDINVVIHHGNIELAVINPKREKSGIYTVIMRNAQGEASRDINVNIMDKPTPPQKCVVDQVFHDNCVVNWKEPVDDGGTEIKRYVVEALDRTAGTDWHQVGVDAAPGDRKQKITNLAHKHRYRFRVRAVNKIGESQPCEMSGDDILIKDPWDEPTQPGRPNILDWGPSHCDMSWTPPESDGGSPITHYVIEFKEKSMPHWQHGKTLEINRVREKNGLVYGTCDGLVEGSEYMFRVKAVNIGSKGQWNHSIPSEPSDSMIAKIRYMKAFLHEPGMYDIEIKKGRTFRYDLWFGGEPPPNVTWEKDGVAIQPGPRITMDLTSKKTVYCERNTILTVTKSVRAEDTGHYTIRLTCEGGNFSATGYVNVLDVPLPPRNFRPDEVRQEHCKLSWEPPQDDGGTPILKYLIKLMDLDQNEWIQACEVNVPTTNCVVKNLKPGHLYRFEVYAINKEGPSLPTPIKDPIKAESPYKPPTEPKEPAIGDFDNKSVTLKWWRPTDDGGRPITHYIIQKKDQFGGWFDALVTDDDNCCATIDELEARVPGLSEGKWYQFRICAVNKAGESWPSFETKPHLCRHKNLSPSIGKTGGSKSVKCHRMTLWHIKVKGEPPPTFSWYKDGQKIETNDKFLTSTEEWQGGATAILQINKTLMQDAGTYTLKAENRNGKDSVDLDLVVLDTVPECECDMFKLGNLECNCTSAFRARNELNADQFIQVEYGVDIQSTLSAQNSVDMGNHV